jgi:signal peptidase I
MRRNPIAAVVLSLLLPGLGHLYAGRPKLARNRFLLALGAGVIGQALLLTYVLGRASFPVTVFLVLGAYAFVTFDAAKAAERAPVDYAPRRFNRWYVYVAVFAAAVVFTQLERAAVRVFVQSYRILSDNMEPTLLIGDFIVVSKRWGDLPNLQHGSIVMHELTDLPGIEAIKRVAGLPGDTLAMIEHVLYLNGVPLEEPYVKHTQPGVDPTDPNMHSWQLPHYIGEDTTNYRPSLKNWGHTEGISIHPTQVCRTELELSNRWT